MEANKRPCGHTRVTMPTADHAGPTACDNDPCRRPVAAGAPWEDIMPTSRAPYTVVVLPAYQAERTLSATVADLPLGAADHVLLVDDASRDATVAVARSLGLDVRTRPRNGGYGANQKT